MSFVDEMKDKVLRGEQIDRQEALQLWASPLSRLREAADEIRRRMCGDGFDLCTIVNGKCGRCSEDCKYCAQSAHYQTACVPKITPDQRKRIQDRLLQRIQNTAF